MKVPRQSCPITFRPPWPLAPSEVSGSLQNGKQDLVHYSSFSPLPVTAPWLLLAPFQTRDAPLLTSRRMQGGRIAQLAAAAGLRQWFGYRSRLPYAR